MTEQTYTAFVGHERLVTAPLPDLLTQVRAHLEGGAARGPLLIFEDGSGRQTDFDLSGSVPEMLRREAPPALARPSLHPIPREAALLPRHWAWLDAQPGGASAALQQLMDAAGQRTPDAGRQQQAQAAADRFMHAMAGDLPDLEDASRALYRGDHARLEALTRAWPPDVRAHLLLLAAPLFPLEEGPPEGEARP